MIAVSVQWDTAGMTRLDRTLGTYQGDQLNRRVDAAMGKAVRPLAGKLKTAERASGIHNRTGEHLRKISVKKARKRPGEAAAWTAGPRDRKRHLLIRSHRIVTPGGRDTGRRSRAFPYVDGVIAREAPLIVAKMSSEVWAMGLRR